MKATYKEIKSYLANRDRLQLITDSLNHIGELEKVSAIHGKIGTGEIVVRIGNDVYSMLGNIDVCLGVSVVPKPAWRTETNLSGLVSMTPPQADLIPSNIPTKQPTP